MRVQTDRAFQTPNRPDSTETSPEWASHMQEFFGRGNEVRIDGQRFGAAEFNRLLHAPPEQREALAREITGQPGLDYGDFRRLIDDVARAAPTASERSISLSRSQARQLGVVDTDRFQRNYAERPGATVLRDRPTTRARLTNDALGVMNTQPARHLNINGVDLSVQGANDHELGMIQTTLSRLPASHLRTLPPIVVADTIAHGSHHRGGAFMPQHAVDSYMRRAQGVAGDLQAAGWENRPRLELTHEALARPQYQRDGVIFTLLHETGHAVDAQFRIARGLTPESLGNIAYEGSHTSETDPRGPVMERFGDAYMYYWAGRLQGKDPTAFQTLQTAMQTVDPEAFTPPPPAPRIPRAEEPPRAQPRRRIHG